METRVFRAGKGDCLLLKSDEGKEILIDGGVNAAYEDHLAKYFGDMREDGREFDLVCVSHIDRDHIGGILKMLDNEVKWRIWEMWESMDPALRPRRSAKPKIKRPPHVKSIWHNAFFETLRSGFIGDSDDISSSFDMEDILRFTAEIYAGGQSDQAELGLNDNSISAIKAAQQTMFYGQSVGDAIELSRRIGPEQLGIPLNIEFASDNSDTSFVLRPEDLQPIDLAGFKISVLGPSEAELEALIATWNEWLIDKETYLKGLLKKHDKDAAKLSATSGVGAVISAASRSAIELGGNEAVTPPNVASIILLIEDKNDSILLTGDADDTSILSGLEHWGHLDSSDRNSQYHVDIFKVPHHGAHNSYSDELAFRVTARHYVFCGDGAHDNPELDVLKSYLEVLFEGKNGKPPALMDTQRVRFWFNCSEKLAPKKYKSHWRKIENLLKRWRVKRSGFDYRFKTSGQVFTVR